MKSKVSKDRPDKGDKDLRAHWKQIREDRKAIASADQVEASIEGYRIQLVAPFREGFPADARKLAGRWRQRSYCWSFPASNATQRKALADLIVKYHGDAQLPDLLREKVEP